MIPLKRKKEARRPTPKVLSLGQHIFNCLKHTPMHPQWIALRDEEAHLRTIAALLHGQVLEIGSGNRRLHKYLHSDTCYIGLDYPPSGQRYDLRPDVWGDASRLPFQEASMDGVVMLEVLEHLPEPRTALLEAARVAKPGARVLLSLPFLYPIHDAPYDFSRITQFGLKRMAMEANLDIISMDERGVAADAAALLASLALAKMALQATERLSFTAIAALPLMLFVPLINVMGWFLSWLIPVKRFMPMGYVAVLTKKG
jgi:SAM-dependent methyltransferase